MDGKCGIRQLFIMRHAERVDFTFGAWIKTSFDEKGTYIRTNLNMPITVPKRKGGPYDFYFDCPLTRIGLHQATLTGEALKESGVQFTHVFCSPALRCLQTCSNVLKASEQHHLPINIEPALFEWKNFFPNDKPQWMSPQEQKEYGYNVNLDYEPYIKATDLFKTGESIEEYYSRSLLVTTKLLEKYSGTILLVAHAGSLDACSRQLIGKSPRNEAEFHSTYPKVPYASFALVEQKSDNTWQLAKPPILPLMHTNNNNFVWGELDK